ncbi:hypothetical protein [Nosocomiicoccus ampullae]|uniref:hypothetical protein n=1 Tax=Nosocomiicoccus ampullae TaxID=489910 RepID=UPI0025501985|nr:hypothetical protein [Nosocomiicoccus ampullae]MDK6862803.1 hypothetical protein [Nosocomiicoccus ampullae]
MMKWHKTVMISAPIDEVFHLFNVEHFHKVKPELKRIEVIRKTPDKVGSTYRVTHEEHGKTIQYIVTLDRYEDDADYKLLRFSYTISNFFQKSTQYKLIKKQQRETELIYSGEMRGKYFLGNIILKMLSKSQHDQTIETFLLRIKNLYKD